MREANWACLVGDRTYRQGMALSDTERHALELAATPYRYPAVREARALDELGLTPTTYWLFVDRLLDRPDALAEMPSEVLRLRRLRERRAAARRVRVHR